MSNLYSSKPSVKPLKGGSVSSNIGIFDTISANTIQLASINIAGVFEDGILIGATIRDSTIESTIIGAGGTASEGYFTKLQTTSNVTFYNTTLTKYVSWDPTNSIFYVNADLSVSGCSQLGNIRICGNNITATNSNGDINIIPNNLGSIYLKGAIYNISTTGNFYSQYTNGGATLLTKNNIVLNSTSASILLTSYSDQVLTSTNGDVNIISTIGNILLNTPNNIKIPDNTKLIFGASCNNIYSSSGNLNISSCNDIDLLINSSNKVLMPDNSKFQFGTVGNNIIYSSGGSLYINGSNNLTINNQLTQINSTNVKFYDPILSLANYNLVNNDNKDRGIEFNYFDTISNSTKLGWFGYKNTTGRFTFITDAVNNNEIITGDIGNLELSKLVLNNITLSEGGLIDANCGNILNLNSIVGCGNNLLLSGSENITLQTSNRLSFNSSTDILIPSNIPLKFGTTGSYLTQFTSGDLIATAYNNIYLTTKTSGGIVIPINTYLSFDGSTSGQQRISSNTSGDLILQSNKNIYLTTTGGNIIIPENTNIQLGNNTQSIYGNTSGINVISSSTTSSLIFSGNSNVTINSSFGNIILDSNKGDINLLTTTGNVRIPQNTRLIFSTNGTSNSLLLTNSNLVITGNTTNDISISNATNIDLSASSNINVLTNTKLNLSNDKSTYLYSDSSGGMYVTNTLTSGSLNLTSTTLNTSNTNTNITVQNLIINGTTGSMTSINSDNVKIKDPILTLANYVPSITDSYDRGIEYNFRTTTGTSLGWFGMKNSTKRFTYFLDATNGNEVISGNFGDFEMKNLYTNGDIIFNTKGSLNMACGTLGNVNTITGCNGILNITTSTLNLSAAQQIIIPVNTPIKYNDLLYINGDNTGNLTLQSTNTIITGNLNVTGTNVKVQDPIITLAGVTEPISNDLKDKGIEFKWYSNTAKLGFFGYKDNIGRFVFIKDAINTNEVITGAYSDVQFGNAYLNNINFTNGGTITGISTLSGGAINITTTSGDISLTPTTGNNIIIPYSTKISFGNTNTSISGDSSGNLLMQSTSGSIDIYANNSVNFLEDKPIYIGNAYINYNSTTNNLSLINNNGDILLTPKTNVIIPTGNNLIFGSTSNSIYSDGSQLYLNGFNGIQLSSGNINISGNVNIVGTLGSAAIDFDLNKYILPLGTYQILNISSIVSTNLYTGGNIIITTTHPHNLVINDSVILKNTNSTPEIDGTYDIIQILSNNSFLISGITITENGSNGNVKSNLTTEQGKDVGIQVNYWSTTGNASITSGTVGFKIGFFGFKRNTERWSFLKDATIANNVVTGGSLSDIEVNELYTNKISGFILDGAITGGSNAIIGTNFQINGGSINSTPIGNVTPNSGNFSNLSNTVQAQLTRLSLQSTLIYSIDRYTLTSLVPNKSPDVTKIVTLFSVQGVSFTSSSGTMPSASITDGTMKMIICSGMDTGCSHTLFFGAGKLITPNPINAVTQPTKLIFKRQGQSVQLLYDANSSAWILLNSGCYVA